LNTYRGIIAIYYFAAMFGCFFGGWVGDKIGRRRGVLIGSLWCLLGGALQAGSHNDKMFICARVISGIGIGFINSTIPSWVSELAESHSRGFTFSIVFSANYLGLSLINWILYGVRNDPGGFAWRFPLACVCFPSVIIMFTVWFVPESPRWLVGNGKEDEAREILSKLRGDLPLDHPGLEAEMAQLIATVEAANHKRNRLYNIMLGGRHSGALHLGRRAVLACAALMMMMYTGIMAVSTYSAALFAASGASPSKIGWMSGLVQTMGFVGTLAAAPVVDRFGRRVTLYMGLAMQLIVLFLAAAFSKISGERTGSSSESYGAAASAMVFLYVFFFCQTTLVVCWIYPTEIWPQEIRAKGNAFGILGWAMGAGSTTLAIPTMFETLGWQTFLVFACLNAACLPLTYFFLPETANRSLEEINLLFTLNNPFVSKNEAAYRKRIEEAGGNVAVAERRLLDSVNDQYSEKGSSQGSPESGEGGTDIFDVDDNSEKA
jgi:sugar porter (SP) family MFS transporter